jgi:response regulator RpfG family c-di-GMP phosphodiesterase
MLHLRIIRGPGKEDWLSIADKSLPFTVGRDRGNKLHIRSSAVSRFHAVLIAQNGDHYVEDLGSTNGTFLNGKQIKKSQVSPGDKITIANVDILVEAGPSPFRDKRAPLELTVSIDQPITNLSAIAVKNPVEELATAEYLERVHAEAPAKSLKALRVLYRADRIARDIEDFGQMLDNLMDLIFEVIPASRGYIFLIDRETELLVPYVRRVPGPSDGDAEIIVSRTILKTAVERKESVLSSDALVDERFMHSQSVSDLCVRSAMCAPLVNRGKVLGVIYIDSTDRSNLYTKEDLSLLSAMALKAGASLANARLYEDLRDLFYNTVETLIRAIQARDKYTSGHSARVSRYALLIGEKFGLTSRERHELYLASMLHDIGKIGIPDELLNREDKLTDDQIRQIRNHVNVGASMLKALGEMNPIVPLILHHHEAWDGSGYPDGLSGEEIPLMARILAVADSFDAMTSDRPYRKAMSRSAAIAEIKQFSGRSFDPAVVEAFLEVIREQTAIEVDAVPQPVR